MTTREKAMVDRLAKKICRDAVYTASADGADMDASSDTRWLLALALKKAAAMLEA